MSATLLSSKSITTIWRAGAVAAALVAATAAAHAGGGVSVGVDVGLPVFSNAVYAAGAPVAAISVRGGHGGHGGRYGGYRGGHYRGGGGWGWGLGIGIGTGLLLASPWAYPGVVVTQPPATVIVEQQAAAALPPQPLRPEPVIYPRNGQSPQQLEADRQECNRWATTQPAALNDSNVFMRAVDACMDGRGYTTR